MSSGIPQLLMVNSRKFEAVPQEAIDSAKFIPDLPIVLPDRDSKQISGQKTKH